MEISRWRETLALTPALSPRRGRIGASAFAIGGSGEAVHSRRAELVGAITITNGRLAVTPSEYMSLGRNVSPG